MFCTMWLLSFLVASGLAHSQPTCLGADAASPQCLSNEAPHRRDIFYIGGRYVFSPTFRGNQLIDQVYVEKLTPLSGACQPHPVVFFHGGGFSGTTWLQTPDNRKGLASLFLERGYQVYLLDQTSVGRSTQQDLEGYPLVGASTAEAAEIGFTVPEKTNAYPQSQLHTQWPGAGIRGDPIFDAFFATALPFTSNLTRQEISMRSAGCALLASIGPSFLISHSIGALFPVLLSDQCPDLVAGNINLEPATTPFQSYTGNATSSVGRRPNRVWGLTNTPLKYDPPAASPSDLSTVTVGEDTPGLRSCILQTEPAKQLVNLVNVPYVALTGEASPHITYNHCVIDYLRQAGVPADWIKLGEIGIRGNGHFLHLEKNNDQIAEVIDQWIRQVIQTE